jgi:hypothetical protein
LVGFHEPDFRNLNFFSVFWTQKKTLNIFSAIYKSTISSFSKALSNCSNSSSNFASIPISSKRLEGDLQPIL